MAAAVRDEQARTRDLFAEEKDIAGIVFVPSQVILEAEPDALSGSRNAGGGVGFWMSTAERHGGSGRASSAGERGHEQESAHRVSGQCGNAIARDEFGQGSGLASS